MERWIESPVEPTRLILAWQSPPEGVEDRSRWAVGQLERDGKAFAFRYFAGSEFAEMNRDRMAAALAGSGFLGYPAFNWRMDQPDVFREGALEAFLRRVPSQGRSDFPQYLHGFRMRPRPGLSGLLLGLTSAALPSDGFTLVDPLDPDVQRQDVLLEIAGHHYHAASTSPLTVGQRLELVREPTHAHDPWAVQVRHAGALVVYVNRLQSFAVTRWVDSRAVEAWVARVNGSSARPRAHMLVVVREEAMAPAL